MTEYSHSTKNKEYAENLLKDTRNGNMSPIGDVPQSTTRGNNNNAESLADDSSLGKHHFDISATYGDVTELLKVVMKSRDDEIANLKSQLANMKLKMEEQESENTQLRNKFKQIKLFHHNIGQILYDCIESEDTFDITESFQKIYPEINRFHYEKDDQQWQRLEADNKNLLELRSTFRKDIEHEISHNFQTLTNNLSQKVSTETDALNTFKTDTIEDIRRKLDDHLEILNKQNALQEEIADLKINYNDLQNKFEQLHGNDQEKLKWEKINFPNITRELYTALKINEVENLDMVSLQNVVKRVALELNVPSDTLLVNLPRISILLEEFSIMMEFICWVFQMFAEQNFDCHMFTDQAIDYYLKTGSRSVSVEPFKSAIDRLRDILVVFLTESENTIDNI